MRLGIAACSISLLIFSASSARTEGFEPSALHQAVQQENYLELQTLLENGAELEARDAYGRTPLYVATRAGNLELMRALLARGADPNAENLAGLTPLHAASANGHTDAVRLLLENCASVNARDRQKRTSLHLAAARGFLPIARELVYSNAALEARLASGLTPFETAISNHQPDTREFLRAQLPPLPPKEPAAGANAEGGAELPSVESGPLLSSPAGAGLSDPGPSDGGASDPSQLDPLVPALPPTAATLRPERPRGTDETLRFVQEKLTELGYDPGPVSGGRTARLVEAVAAFQQAAGSVRESERGQITSCLVDRLTAASLRSSLDGVTMPAEDSRSAANLGGF